MVALAQMQDVAGGHLPNTYDKESVIALYTHKTARYTFSMPFLVGSSLAGADMQTKTSLERLGVSLGMLFQIRDDELSQRGDTTTIGKSVGIDQEGHKQTLSTIMQANDLEKYRRQLRIDAQTIIRSLPVSDDHIRELTALLQFCEDRTK
jgi:geranylgeranyl pyrophosphate synthase